MSEPTQNSMTDIDFNEAIKSETQLNSKIEQTISDLLDLPLDDKPDEILHKENAVYNTSSDQKPAAIGTTVETEIKQSTEKTENNVAVDEDKKPRDWNTFIGEKTTVISKSIADVSVVAREKLSTSISVVQNIAAEKAGLLVGKNYMEFAKEDGSHEVTVIAGKATNIPFFVPKNTAIAWKMMVKNFDVGVVVKIREQADGGAIERDLEPFWKINQDELFMGGRRAVDFDRYFILVFDNTYSKLRPKTVIYQVLTGEAAALALEQAEFTAKNKAEEEAAAAEAAALAAANNNTSGSNSKDASPPVGSLNSANATVRYVTEGLKPIVSSVIIKVQTASTAISTQAKTTAETIQTTDWSAKTAQVWGGASTYLNSWVKPAATGTATAATPSSTLASDGVVPISAVATEGTATAASPTTDNNNTNLLDSTTATAEPK